MNPEGQKDTEIDEIGVEKMDDTRLLLTHRVYTTTNAHILQLVHKE